MHILKGQCNFYLGRKEGGFLEKLQLPDIQYR